jgi:hypothetical protein
LGTGLAVLVGVVVVAGPARVALLAVGGVLCLAVVRWPRWDARLFQPRSSSPVLVRPDVWTKPVAPINSRRLGAEAHRAYAQALHAVAAAYLAECEREVQR